MKILADWIVKNEELFLRPCLENVLPYIDKGVLVDTGSRDKTMEIALDVQKKFPHLEIKTCDIGPNYDLSKARNVGLHSIPQNDWIDDDIFYFSISGDEVYDESIKNLREALAKVPKEVVWVRCFGRGKEKDKDGNDFINPAILARPQIYRFCPGMIWRGYWNHDFLFHPTLGHYMAGHEECPEHPWPANPPQRKPFIWPHSGIWYDNYHTQNGNRELRYKVYQEFEEMKKKGIPLA